MSNFHFEFTNEGAARFVEWIRDDIIPSEKAWNWHDESNEAISIMISPIRYCEYKGCGPREIIFSYVIPGVNDDLSDDETDLCLIHAEKLGYCLGCQYFMAGIESFDFPDAYGAIEGFCLDCSHELMQLSGYDDDDIDPDSTFYSFTEENDPRNADHVFYSAPER